MKEIKQIVCIQFCQMEELSEEDRALVNKAIEATQNAYANYSHFYVGAALRLSNGLLVTGANQENAAFPSGLCAERTALFSAQAHYPGQPVESIAIAAKNEKGLLKSPVSPCGACRQVMVGIEDRYQRSMRVLLYGTDGIYMVKSARDLMPLTFVDDSMK